MDYRLKARILELLDRHRIMTLATLRSDGWPQATTVGYAHEGTTLYFLCAPDSQKAHNLARDNRVSLTIDHDTDDVMQIAGLSMAAHAAPVTADDEKLRVLAMLFGRYGAQPGVEMPMPELSEIAVFRLTPTVISVLDYTRGFAHSDLVTC